MQAGSVLRGLGAAGRGDAGGGGGLPAQLLWSPGQLGPQLPARGQGQHHRHPPGPALPRPRPHPGVAGGGGHTRAAGARGLHGL